MLVYRSKGRPKIRTYQGGGLWIDHLGKYAAFGSGGAYALGALAAGATAREAVKIAMKFDCGSGGIVKAIDL